MNDSLATISRRDALAHLSAAAGSAALFGADAGAAPAGEVPSHLKGFEALWAENPRRAAIEWFKQARFGLFMHYGLYSLLGHGEWVMLREKIPVAEYVKLKDRFKAERFDAEAICDLALEAGMKYVNLTSRHHDSFCLFATRQTDYNSVQSPCGRDLVGELVAACRKRGLGCFLYYSYAADWKHPYFYPREEGWQSARPAYDKPEPTYLYKKPEDFKHYIDFCHAQLRELLTQYGPIAGIWLDPIMGLYARPDLFPIHQTYRLIRSLQPHCLISFKQGANGDEDFVAPERKSGSHRAGTELSNRVWEMNRGKPAEICNTLQPHAWGYDDRNEGKHRTADDVIEMLAEAGAINANLLLNTGPLPDGSIHPDDVRTLREVGRRLRAASK